jgi:hypothetical protein
MARLHAELKGTIGPDMDRELTRQAMTEYAELKRRP